MKAITIRQPWAWAICEAGKRIENRTWGTRYRGPLLIHAGKGCTTAEFDGAAEWMEDSGLRVPTLAEYAAMPRGAVVAICDLVDVVRASTDPWFVGPVGLVLANVRTVPPVHMPGALGLFEVDWSEVKEGGYER